MQDRRYTAIGLMSGTSLDGVDAAILYTDGEAVFGFGPAISVAYDDSLKASLRDTLARVPALAATAQKGEGAPGLGLDAEITGLHATAVAELLGEAGLTAADADVIGFHGQTVFHAPERGLSWQVGDGALLAERTGIDVVADFRSADVEAGGEGAPLAPIYHLAAVRDRCPLERIAVVNLGGVANLTWIDLKGDEPGLVAFDTGPGNALLDDWMAEKAGLPYDRDGATGLAGQVHSDRIEEALRHPHFSRPPPKSLDRNSFSLAMAEGLSLEDGAATLAAFTAAAIGKGFDLLPGPAEACFVCGGGRWNIGMLAGLREALGIRVDGIEALGLRGDFIEAELMAYLAVRSLRGLALTFPRTTGVPAPCPGGTLYPAPGKGGG